MWLDQSVRFPGREFFLQLEQNVFIVFEEGVDDLLGITLKLRLLDKNAKPLPAIAISQ